MEQNEKKTVKVVGFMMVIMLVGKVLGLLRDMFLASFYGSSAAANAFTVASLIPRTFFDAMFASAISASFIPVFNQLREREGEERAFGFAHAFVTLIGVISLVLTVVGVAAARPLAALYGAGFDQPTLELCVELLRILFPTIFFTGIAYSYVGVLQSLDEFGIPAALSIASNGVIILYYIFLDKYFGIYGLAVAFLVGWAMQMLIQLPALRKKGYTLRPRLARDPGLKQVGLLMLPVMVSTWIQPINLTICTRFASRLFEGSAVADINYANNLYTIIVGVVVSSIANVIFPKLSRQKANADEEGFGRTLSVTTKAMCFVVLPLLVGVFVMSTPLVQFLYERNSFTATDTYITSRALRYFALGMLGFGVQTILSRAFYAEQNGRLPLISGAASIAVNVILCKLLVGRWDVMGLAVASAVSATVSALVLAVACKRQSKEFLNRAFWAQFARMLLAAVLMGMVVVMVRRGLGSMLGEGLAARGLKLIVPTVVGVISYAVFSVLFGVDEARAVVGHLRKGGAMQTDSTAVAEERGGWLDGSLVVGAGRKIAGFFSRQFQTSFLIGHFLNPLPEERPDSVFARLFYGIVGLLRRFVYGCHLDRLLTGSLFANPFVWSFLAMVLAPLLPTMGVLALVLLAFVATALKLILQKDGRLAYSAVNPAIYLFALVYLFGTLTSVTVRGSLFGGLLSICFLLFAIVVQNAIQSKRQLDVLIFFLCGVGLLVSLYGFYQYMFPAKFSGVWHDVDMFQSISFRVYSTLSNPNVLGEYLVLIIPLAFAGLLTTKGLLNRVFYLVSFAAMLLCLALTYSRGCYVAILVAGVIFLVMLDRRFLILVLLGLLALPFVLPETILNRFLSIGDMADSSTSYRVYIWMGSLAMLRRFWLSGIGPGTAAFNQVYPLYAYNGISAPHSHNLYLQVMVDAGICGLITFLAVMFLFFKRTCSALAQKPSRKTRIYLIAVISGVFGFLVQSLFDYTFYNYRVMLVFWAVVALGLVFARRDELE